MGAAVMPRKVSMFILVEVDEPPQPPRYILTGAYLSHHNSWSPGSTL